MIMVTIFFILSICAIVLNFLGLSMNDNAWACGFFGSILLLIAACVGVYAWGDKPEPCPTAIDVYRGNTTLEITYRDSIAVDSVVVWKEE